MSSLADTAEPKLSFRSRLQTGKGIGKIYISGIDEHLISRVPKHNPLGDIWSQVRKQIKSDYRIDVVAGFSFRAKITCTLVLSTANIHANTQYMAYQEFERRFSHMVKLFKSILEEWVSDEKYGCSYYNRYIELSGESFCPEIGHTIMTNFLFQIGAKEADAERACAFRERLFSTN